MIRGALLSGLTILAAPAAAQVSDPAAGALEAVAQLEAASELLSAAQEASDQVAALTQTVHAYEEGLVALRDGIRRAAARKAVIEAELAAKRDEVSRLLGVLQSMSTSPAPLLLLHPSGPLGTARSGMILSDITPALQAEALALREKLAEVAFLNDIQTAAAEHLNEGLNGAQEARAALSKAIQNRTELPRRFAEDPVQTALLIASAETLDAFANSLDATVAEVFETGAPDALTQKGSLPLPVAALVLRRAGEADAAGVVRPGVVLAARPLALVTAPATSTVRFAGPLLNYGNVIILEPAADVLFVIAGLGETYGAPGEIVNAGSPIGLMGGNQPDPNGNLTQASDTDVFRASETLYLEVREGDSPVDPATWFVME